MSAQQKSGAAGGAKLAKSQMNPTATYGGAAVPACKRLVTIRITKRGIVNHRQPVQRGDCVRWCDQTGTARVLVFIRWPFVETWQSVNVPAGGCSPIYHVAQVEDGSYPYKPEPSVAVGPPDPPDLVVGG